jgi:hypothetical protein
MLIAMLLSTQILISGKCGQQNGPAAPPSLTKEIRVSVSSNWPISWPAASTCTGTGPRLGNNPIYDNGSSSLYQNTNLRFTEVKLRNLVTNAVSSKLWANSGPNGTALAGYEVIMNAPLDAGYEIIFTQYDRCSSSCLQAQTSNGVRPVRLFWTKSMTFGQYGPTYITMEPQYFGAGNQICN